MCSSSFLSVLSILLNDHEVEYIKFQCISFFSGSVNGNELVQRVLSASHKDDFKPQLFRELAWPLFLANERRITMKNG
jgi:hypothetical protein